MRSGSRDRRSWFAAFVCGPALVVACELDTTGSEAPSSGGAGTAAASGSGGANGGAAGSASGGAGASGAAGSDAGIAGSAAVAGTAGIAGAAGTAGTDGGAVVPTDIAGDLQLWLRADLGVTVANTLVSKWADQSGKGHDYAQADPALQPAFAAAAIGGKPCVRFLNGPKFLTGSGFSYTSGATLFLVVRLAATPTTIQYFELFGLHTAGAWTRVGFTGAPDYEQLYFGAAGSLVRAVSPATDTVAHLYEISWNGGAGNLPASYTLSVDGTPTTIVTAAPGAFTPKTAIGAFVDNPPAYFRGVVGEIVVFGNVLSPADHAALRASMAAFWGVP